MNCPQCQRPAVEGTRFCSGCGAATAATPTAASPGRSRRKARSPALWVVGILFIGLCLAVTLPELLFNIEHDKQKQTMRDMKTLATAVDQYYSRNGHYPEGDSIAAACKALVPAYLTDCPRTDGWSSETRPREFRYAVWPGDPSECPAAGAGGRVPPVAAEGPASAATAPHPASCEIIHYVIASAGRDGKFMVNDPRHYPSEQVDTGNYNSDIVIRDGQFLRAPLGKQSNGPAD